MSIELIFIVLLVILANIVEASDVKFLRRNFPWFLLAINLPLIPIGLLLSYGPEQIVTEAFAGSLLPIEVIRSQGINLLWISVLGAVCVFPLTRTLIARISKLEPHNNVHALAVMLGGYLIGLSVASLNLGGLEALAELDLGQDIWDVLGQQFMFAVLALVGVGLVIRRNDRSILRRLDLRRLNERQFFQALFWAIPLVILQWAAGSIWWIISPEQVELFESVNGSLLASIDTWWEWLLLALATGIGEELLFRGAIQEKFGNGLTVLLFTVAHTQYALSPATVVIAVFAYVLGYLRREHGTVFTMIVHFSYNFALGMLALLAQNVPV